MAQIKQLGPGRKTNGTIDGITYVTRNGVTYVRSTPTMPASVYKTPEAKKRQAIFKMVQMHMKYHHRTIKQTFTPSGNGTASNRYYSVNGKALTMALTPLTERYVAGENVTIDHVEQAICDYAAEHAKSIQIAAKSGYNDVFLTGPWPNTITLNALVGDNTVIIIVAENGTTTTINADGTTTVTNSSSGSGSGSGTDGGSGSSTSNPSTPSNPSNPSGTEGGDNTGGGSGTGSGTGDGERDPDGGTNSDE